MEQILHHHTSTVSKIQLSSEARMLDHLRLFNVVIARNYYTVHEKYGNTVLYLSPSLFIQLPNLVADIAVLNTQISAQQSDTFYYEIDN